MTVKFASLLQQNSREVEIYTPKNVYLFIFLIAPPVTLTS